jgi:hypothetical protein
VFREINAPFWLEKVIFGNTHSPKATTVVSDYHPIKQFQMMKFNGKSWDFVGGIASF